VLNGEEPPTKPRKPRIIYPNTLFCGVAEFGGVCSFIDKFLGAIFPVYRNIDFKKTVGLKQTRQTPQTPQTGNIVLKER
jgi:hypothetical protein